MKFCGHAVNEILFVFNSANQKFKFTDEVPNNNTCLLKNILSNSNRTDIGELRRKGIFFNYATIHEVLVHNWCLFKGYEIF